MNIPDDGAVTDGSHAEAPPADTGADADAQVTADAEAGADADATPDAQADADASPPPPDAQTDVMRDPSTYCARGADVPMVTAPPGFCVKLYGTVGEARALAVAPNGDLFVSAPSRATPGGATGGPGAILVLSDDDHDGAAEQHMFLGSLTDVHGLALGGGFLYYTRQETVWRTAYVAGQRGATGTPEDLGLPTTFGAGGRWTHGLALSKGGNLVASRGAYALCGTEGGDISAVGAGGALTTLATGLRNPMYMRCHPTDEVCAAMELGEDLASGAREKMILVHPSSQYGYPCCFGNAQPTANAMGATCADVTREDGSFTLSETPFGFDWERGKWPAPFRGAIFVALHGSAYSAPPWQGAAIVYAPTDPTTHAPVQDWQPFLRGFGPAGSPLERPSDVVFAPDGRMFFSDDAGGAVYWMAPLTLQAP